MGNSNAVHVKFSRRAQEARHARHEPPPIVLVQSDKV